MKLRLVIIALLLVSVMKEVYETSREESLCIFVYYVLSISVPVWTYVRPTDCCIPSLQLCRTFQIIDNDYDVC